jgi:hypothetical protein
MVKALQVYLWDIAPPFTTNFRKTTVMNQQKQTMANQGPNPGGRAG